jgi:DNA-binding SARP family transcriptional activator
MHLTLIRSFELTSGDRSVALPMSVQRLVTFLALQDRPMQRPSVAGTLWFDASEEHAAASLRSVIWRLKRAEARLIHTSGPGIRLSAGVRIDLRERTALAHRLLSDGKSSEIDLDQAPFCDDLLPDWYDDWLVIERERFHQLRLRTLELICEHQTAMGHFAAAIEAGLSAVAGEPLRESAHRALVKAHLAEGNRTEALRQFHLYRKLLHNQVGLKPSSQMLELLRSPAETCR